MVKTYDIAISFAGEDRPTAQAIAKSLHEDYMVRVFYDDYEQAVLWGENLTEYLLDIYKNCASYCVILISHAYVASRWARHEWQAAQARALEELDQSYVLSIRLDDAELPGFLPTIGYMDVRKRCLNNVIKSIMDKIKGDVENNRIIRLAEGALKKGDYVQAHELVSDSRFDNDIDALLIRGDALRKSGDHIHAIPILQRLHDMRPHDFLPVFLLAISCFRLMRFDEAVRYYEEAARIEPSHVTVIEDLRSAKKWAARMKNPIWRWLFHRRAKDAVGSAASM